MFMQSTEFAEFKVLTARQARSAQSRETNLLVAVLPWGNVDLRIESAVTDANYPGNLGEVRLALTPEQARTLGEALLAASGEPVR
jgi:uncharacterized protein (DUF1501 family)